MTGPLRFVVISNCSIEPFLGSGYVISHFTDGLRKRGHEVRVYSPLDMSSGWLQGVKSANIRLALQMAFVAIATKTRDIDCAIIWGGQGWLATCILRVKFPRILIVHHSNGPEPKYDPLRVGSDASLTGRAQRLVLLKLSELAFRFADRVVTTTLPDAQWLIGAGLVADERVAAITPALPPEFITRPANHLRENVIGYCGTWLPKKGNELIVQALPVVLRNNPGWRLELVGVGNDFDKSLVFPADVADRVEVVPYVFDKARLRRKFNSWSIFMMPSALESFGLVLAEAMSQGCACVATRVGFSAALEHGRDLIHIDYCSQALLDAINRLVADLDLRKRISAAAQERVSTLNWEVAITEYERQISRWVAQPSKTSPA